MQLVLKIRFSPAPVVRRHNFYVRSPAAAEGGWLLAGVLGSLVHPTHPESVQNEPVGERQSIGLEDCSVGIVDTLVPGDAPGS
jgi:hypothetical protein